MLNDAFWGEVALVLMRGYGMTPFEVVMPSNVLMFQEVVS